MDSSAGTTLKSLDRSNPYESNEIAIKEMNQISFNDDSRQSDNLIIIQDPEESSFDMTNPDSVREYILQVRSRLEQLNQVTSLTCRKRKVLWSSTIMWRMRSTNMNKLRRMHYFKWKHSAWWQSISSSLWEWKPHFQKSSIQIVFEMSEECKEHCSNFEETPFRNEYELVWNLEWCTSEWKQNWLLCSSNNKRWRDCKWTKHFILGIKP